MARFAGIAQLQDFLPNTRLGDMVAAAHEIKQQDELNQIYRESATKQNLAEMQLGAAAADSQMRQQQLEADQASSQARRNSLLKGVVGFGDFLSDMRRPSETTEPDPWNKYKIGDWGNIDWNKTSDIQFRTDLPDLDLGIEPSDLNFVGNLF